MIRSFNVQIALFFLFIFMVISFISSRYILAYSCTGAFGKAKPASHSKAMAAEPSQSRATRLDSSSKKRHGEPAEALGDARPSTARHVHVGWALPGQAAISSQAVATRLDSVGTKRSKSSESEDPWAGVGADSSGPPTPDFGNMGCTGPPCWQVGEDFGGLSNSF